MEAKKLVGESPSFAHTTPPTDWSKKLIGARGIHIFLRLPLIAAKNKCVLRAPTPNGWKVDRF